MSDITLELGPVEGTDITLDVGPVEGTSITFDVGAPTGGGGGGAPSGDAGGDLDGTYPNPTIGAGKVTNTMLAGSIALSKLATDPLARANHTGTQTLSTISDAGTLAGLSAIASAQITDGTIVDADINASAAIAQSKIASLTTDLGNKAATSALVYPRRVSIACGLSPPHSSNTWAATASAVAYSGYGTSTAASSGAETWTYYLLMDAGTWSFRLVRRTNGTSAKILPTLGGTALTELEGWSNPNAGDVASTETGITVATAGHITFTLTNPNRHASSSGWGWTIQGFEFWRTGP